MTYFYLLNAEYHLKRKCITLHGSEFARFRTHF